MKRRAKGQNPEESPAQSTFYKRYAKLEMVFDTRTHLAIGVLASKGPAPDIDRLVPLLPEADLHVKIKSLLADAGYDSESNHVFTRVGCGIRSLMPATHGRSSDKPPTGYWRRQMRVQLSTKTKRRRSGYTQRAQAETGFSMIKRRQGESVAARTFENQCRELRLMVLTHNLMISYVGWGFLSPKNPYNGLWQPRIPKAKPTLLLGDPASGKTSLLLALAAHLSTATPLPTQDSGLSTQDSPLPSSTLLLNPDDNAADTLRPKLEALHANLDFIHILPNFPSLIPNPHHSPHTQTPLEPSKPPSNPSPTSPSSSSTPSPTTSA